MGWGTRVVLLLLLFLFESLLLLPLLLLLLLFSRLYPATVFPDGLLTDFQRSDFNKGSHKESTLAFKSICYGNLSRQNAITDNENNIVVKSLCYGNLDQTSFRGVIKMGTHLNRPKVFEFLFVMEIGPDNFKGA